MNNSLITYIKDPSRILYGLTRRLSPFIKNDKTYLKLLYYIRVHKPLNLDNPQTFSEKIQWLKLYDRKPEYTTMVDKYDVKEYVAKIIGEEYVIPTLGVWDRPEDVEWDELPDKFILKTTHGGGSVGVVMCRDKEKFDKSKAIKKLMKSLKQDIYKELREWPYKNVIKRIIAEPLLEGNGTDTSDLIDYKFFCFGGEPRFIQLDFDRFVGHKKNLYSLDWELLPFSFNYPRHPECVFPKPKGLNRMIEIAHVLSKGFPFIRVDMYNINGKIFVGELTFFPASGLGAFTPEKYNEIFGKMIALPEMRG